LAFSARYAIWSALSLSRIGLAAVGGRHVVIDHQQRLVGRVHLAAGQPQALERLRRRHLMDDVAVDVEQAGAVRLLIDQMVGPDLVVKRARFHRVSTLQENAFENGRSRHGDRNEAVAQSSAWIDAVSRPKKRPGRRAWSPRTILRA